MCESDGKADLLSDHFDSKHSRESVDLPLTCHPSPSLVTFAFRSSEVRRLLLDLDPCGGTDTLGMFPLFLKRTADILAPRLSVVFRRLLRPGSFPACWRQANVTPIQNAVDIGQWSASRFPVCVSARARYLRCTIVRVP